MIRNLRDEDDFDEKHKGVPRHHLCIEDLDVLFIYDEETNLCQGKAIAMRAKEMENGEPQLYFLRESDIRTMAKMLDDAKEFFKGVSESN